MGLLTNLHWLLGLLHVFSVYSNHLFSSKCYPNVLSNAFIPNLILFDLSTKPTRHSHLCYIEFILLLVFYYPTFNSTKHRLITPKALIQFIHPTWILQFTSPFIFLSFCIMDSQFLNCVTCGTYGLLFNDIVCLELILKHCYFILLSVDVVFHVGTGFSNTNSDGINYTYDIYTKKKKENLRFWWVEPILQ